MTYIGNHNDYNCYKMSYADYKEAWITNNLCRNAIYCIGRNVIFEEKIIGKFDGRFITEYKEPKDFLIPNSWKREKEEIEKELKSRGIYSEIW